MSYKAGEKAPYKGIYRCRKCGEAREYKKGEEFCDCPNNDAGKQDIAWALIHKD